MKAVIKGNSRQEIRKTIDFLLDAGFDSFIIFASIDRKERFILENDLLVWDIRAVVLDADPRQSTYEQLNLVKGSFNDTFFISYSYEISSFNLTKVLRYHKSSSKIATLLSTDQKTVGIVLEVEIFDYMSLQAHFEKEIIKRTFEDHEASIYRISSYK